MLVRETLRKAVAGAIEDLSDCGHPLFARRKTEPAVVIERSSRPGRGDFSCNAAFALAVPGMSLPPDIAYALQGGISCRLAGQSSVEIAGGGFINFHVEPLLLSKVLLGVHRRFFGSRAALPADEPASGCLPAAPPAVQERFDVVDFVDVVTDSQQMIIQHAHARCCAYLRMALEPVLDTLSLRREAPPVGTGLWLRSLAGFQESPEAFSYLFAADDCQCDLAKLLILEIDSFPLVSDSLCSPPCPQALGQYALGLSLPLETYLGVCPIAGTGQEVLLAQLGLVEACRAVLGESLRLLGLAAPSYL